MTVSRVLTYVPAMCLALSGCSNLIQTSDGVGLRDKFDAYVAALAENSEFNSASTTIPTSGDATYQGGAYFDLTPNGASEGDLIASRMTANVQYNAASYDMSASLTDASRFGLSAEDYESFGDAIAGRTDIGSFELFADSFREIENLDGEVTLFIDGVPVSPGDFTTQMNGTLSGPNTTVEVDAPVYGFLTGPEAAGMRLTGTNFGSVEIDVDGAPLSAYFDARGVKQD